MKQLLCSSIFEMVSIMDQKANSILMRESGISFTFFHALAILAQHPPMTQHSLAVKLRFSDPAVSRLVLKLQANNFIDVKIDPSHKRKRLVEVTEEGRNMAEKCGKRLEQEFIDYVVAAGVDPRAYQRLTEAIKEELTNEKIG